ncbi:MAG: phosphoglucomutase/phosphomannomutase family protein [Candidatus Methylomirabilales bacterium]
MSQADIRFGTDGWRGVIADSYTFRNVHRVGVGIGRYLTRAVGERDPQVLVGHDTRFLARRFAETMARSLTRSGCRVALTPGFVTTPMLAAAIPHLGATAGVMITASHNPPQYLGVKLRLRDGAAAPPEVTTAIEGLLDGVGEDGFLEGANHGLPTFDPWPPYRHRLLGLIKLPVEQVQGLTVLTDAMFGASQGYARRLLESVGVEGQDLHARIDPTFGGTGPEPMPERLDGLREALLHLPGSRKVGFAFDGDGDRMAAVDEGGRFVTPHHIYALLLRHLVTHLGRRGRVLKTVAMSLMVDKLAARYSLPVEEYPIGFKYVGKELARGGALMGGEESGGIGFGDHIPERDALLAALRLLEAMVVEGKSLGTLVQDLEGEIGPHRYRRVDLPLKGPVSTEALQALPVNPSGVAPPGTAISRHTLDGLKLRFGDQAWILLRPSGTEPILRLYAEGPDVVTVDRLLSWGQEKIVQFLPECCR